MMSVWSDDDYDFEDLDVSENLLTGKFKQLWWSDNVHYFGDLDVMMSVWSNDDYGFVDVCENLFTGKFEQVLSGRSGDYPIPSSRPSHRSSGWWWWSWWSWFAKMIMMLIIIWWYHLDENVTIQSFGPTNRYLGQLLMTWSQLSQFDFDW